MKQEHESQRGQVRVTLPGGRQLESILGSGVVAIGARTMQEGGAFGSWIREQVRFGRKKRWRDDSSGGGGGVAFFTLPITSSLAY